MGSERMAEYKRIPCTEPEPYPPATSLFSVGYYKMGKIVVKYWVHQFKNIFLYSTLELRAFVWRSAR